jgi:transglutaminase-like putative cysteine protease
MESKKNIGPLIMALGIALVPQLSQLPAWVVLWCVVSWGYVFAAVKLDLPKPGKVVRPVLIVGGILGVLLTPEGGLDQNSSVALLWIMASIKPMEIRTRRDEMVTIFMVFFLAISCLFFSGTLMTAVYTTFSICFTTAVLIHIHHPAGKPIGQLGLSARLLLKAMPLALILFLIFPRIQGSLWGMHRPTQAFSGFSDHLAPGTVTRLVRNNDTAFRVEFDGQIPGPEQLYWRGLVFWHFDGSAWYRSDNSVNISLPLKGKKSVAYTITLEPHNQHWLFALDLPYEFKSNAIMLSDHTLISRWTVRQRIQYRLKSYTAYTTGPIRQWEAAALQLPHNANPAAIALARRWRTEFANPVRIMDAALNYLHNNDFSYTLNPPPLSENSIDDFLFRTRKGFCEHYASAFTFLMRAAGIPARMVAGYLGGELNPFGKYLVVRQSDAHVWVEVYLPGRGWVRTDPTLAVAPQRVEQGMAAVLPPEERSTLDSFSALGPLAKYWTNLRFAWDVVNMKWNRWVLGYSTTRQKSLFAKIGIKAGTRKGLAAAVVLATAAMGFISLFYFFSLSKKAAAEQDAVQKSYLAFCAKLTRRGFARKPSQGPLDYAWMVTAARRDLKTSVLDIVNLYIRLRYGRGGNKDDRKRLKAMVRRFDP